MALFKVVNNQAQLDAGDVASTDVYGAGIRFTQDGAARTTRFAGTAFNQGIPMSPTGQVAIVDATSGLPVDAIYLNGLPISGNKVCVSLNASSVISSGLPFDSNGVLVGSLSGFTTLSLDFTGSTTLDPRITFSRTSNATLTDSNGRVVTSNTGVAPDGTTTADKQIPVAANVPFKELQQNVSITSGVTYTLSEYVKADGYRYIQIVGNSAVFGTFYINYDLQTGNETAFDAGSSTVVGRSITNVGNGWYRVSASVTAISTASGRLNVDVIPAFDSIRGVSWASDGTSGILVWGAQLNVGALQSYNSTTPKNLLGFTQEFDNAAWTQSTVTVSANAVTDPNGTLTADRVTPTGTAVYDSRVFQPISAISGVVYTLSVWAKSSASNPSLTLALLNWGGQTFSLTSNWARYSVSVTAASTISANFNIYAGVVNPTNGVVSSINEVDIWGAQLSNSASVDPYVYNPQAAPTSTAYFGPRFDYNPTTLAANGLLVEEQRTNLVTYSEDFSNAAWVKAGSTVSANATASPDGTTNADKLQEDASTGVHVVTQLTALTSGAQYAFSIYAKAAERSRLNFERANANITAFSALYDLSAGTVVSTSGTVTASILDVGNGWYRLTAVVTAAATASGGVQVDLVSTGSTISYAGVAGNGVFLWGAQLEAGSFATSYIATQASQVTRAADNASMLGDNFATWFNQVQGTIGVNFSFYSAIPAAGNRGGVLALGPGGYAAANALNIFQDGGTQNLAAYFTSATYPDVNLIKSLNAAANATNKAAYAYNKSAGSYALTTNGQSPSTGTSTQNTATFNSMHIGVRNSGSTYLNGTIQSISFYPVALPTSIQSITA